MSETATSSSSSVFLDFVNTSINMMSETQFSDYLKIVIGFSFVAYVTVYVLFQLHLFSEDKCRKLARFYFYPGTIFSSLWEFFFPFFASFLIGSPFARCVGHHDCDVCAPSSLV